MQSKYDILFWADLRPEKHGSFEDFMIALNERAKNIGQSILFVVARGVSVPMADTFRQSRLDYIELSRSELHASRCIFNTIRKFQCNLVHIHFIPLLNTIYHAAKLAGARTVLYTAHFSIPESEYTNRKSSVRRTIRSLVIAPIDRVVTVSKFLKSYCIESLGIAPSKVQVIHNGIDLRRFRPPTAQERVDAKMNVLDLAADTPVVTFVGQLHPQKGILVAIEACDRVSATNNNVKFIFAGEGIERIPNELSGANKVLLGRRDDVQRIMQATDVFIAPSTWYEAFGLSIAEAAASGLPVVASNRGGLPELVVDGESGFTVNAHDVEGLAFKIKQLVDDRGLRERMGVAARRHAENNFDLKAVIEEVMSLYAVDALV